MTSRRRRVSGGWQEPLAYTGFVVSSFSSRAANDNGGVIRALQRKRYARIAEIGLVLASALSFAFASLAFAGDVLGWW